MIQAYWGLTHPSVSSVKQENKFLSQMAKKNIVLCMNSVMYPGGQTQGHGSTRPPTPFPNANVSAWLCQQMTQVVTSPPSLSLRIFLNPLWDCGSQLCNTPSLGQNRKGWRVHVNFQNHDCCSCADMFKNESSFCQ